MRRPLALLLALLAAAAAGAWTPPRAAAGPVVVQRSFRSAALGGTERYAVALPTGYAASGRRYPVLYALHGLPALPDAYTRMPIAEWSAIAEGAGHPAIVVAPQGARAGDTDPEWLDWGVGRNWAGAVGAGVVRDVDRSFRTLPDRRSRALIGISAGGYGATHIGLTHVATFSVIQAWSGYFHPTNPAGTAPLDLGSADANLAASAHTYVPLLPRWYVTWHPMALSFYVGDRDSRFAAENRQLHQELRAAGIPHGFAVYPGRHAWTLWSAHQGAWIRRALRHLAD